MEWIGYVACAFIGISLGLIGAGGSILTVPVLVFLFGMPPMLTTSYSLFIVGVTSLMASLTKFKQGDVSVAPAIAFGTTSMMVVSLLRHFVVPLIPESLGNIGSVPMSYSLLSMVLFAILMMVSAAFMINSRRPGCATDNESVARWWMTIPYAILVGIVTGFLGAGGGFIVIPVMTLFLGMDIKKAVGTSLAVIAMNSLCGFANDLGRVAIDWPFLLLITAIAVLGSITGLRVASNIDSKRLKSGFGWFVLVLGVLIMSWEGYHLLAYTN